MLCARGALVFSFWALALFLHSCRAAPPSAPATGTARPSAAGEVLESGQRGRRLQGRFLHITDLHPDPFYKTYSSTEQDAACHRKRGPAGVYGAETSACDAPLSLVNETFRWIQENLKDEVDFVVWTGDSARHDNDERIPRTQQQVIEQNEFVVEKFRDVFGGEEGFEIPIVPTFGNNDILPHNIFLPGPNRWTLKYLDIWRGFIPEAQRHGFQQGGWFYVEVVPAQLAVISLNTLYLFDSNSGVDGCADKKEPGYEHMEWLRIQLQTFRERGMKAILIGHVPPARTDSKSSWDETCWQKFTLWERQYRDVIVGNLFGHMNIDHFMLHDAEDLHKDTKRGKMGNAFAAKGQDVRESLLEDGEVTAASASDYLVDLGNTWAKLPSPPKTGKRSSTSEYVDADEEKEPSTWEWIVSTLSRSKRRAKGRSGGKGDDKKKKKKQFWEEIGGKYGERFSIVQVAPSVVPNYFPTLRVISYNISGLEDLIVPTNQSSSSSSRTSFHLNPGQQMPMESTTYSYSDDEEWMEEVKQVIAMKKKKKEKKVSKRPKKWKFKMPLPPSKSAPPGPAYSNQPFTLISYTQYFANLTYINNDFAQLSNDSIVEEGRWKEGKHKKHQGKQPRPEPHPMEFKYEVEYDTKHDKRWMLKDLTVRSYVDLARRIGQDKCGGAGVMEDQVDERMMEAESRGKKGKKRKGGKGNKHKPNKNGEWFTFIKRAFVGAMDPSDVEDIFVADGEEVETGPGANERIEL